MFLNVCLLYISTGAVDERRHLPGRRGLRQPHPEAPARGVQEAVGRGRQQGPAGHAAAERGGRKGQVRVVVGCAE